MTTTAPPVEESPTIIPTQGFFAKQIHDLVTKGLQDFGSQKLCDARAVVDLLLDVRIASDNLIALLLGDNDEPT